MSGMDGRESGINTGGVNLLQVLRVSSAAGETKLQADRGGRHAKMGAPHVIKGARWHLIDSIFYEMLRARTWLMLTSTLATYLFFCLAFALLYYAQPRSITYSDDDTERNLAECFFLSV